MIVCTHLQISYIVKMWIIIAIGILQTVAGYPMFQGFIPNGENVPSPCNPNHIWQGVGHWNKLGGGDRNPFGLDFKANGYMWTEELCRTDSDGDGWTNGEELGDPDCAWIKDTPASGVSMPLGHPGICEPLDDPVCMSKNGGMFECVEEGFNCAALQDPSVTNYTVRLTKSQVPAQETTYMCQVVDLPSDKDYHIVGMEPYIDNINVVHHILLYGCNDDAEISEDQTSPYSCFMSGVEGCDEMIGLWAVGMSGICIDVDAAFRIGLTSYKRVLLELHWNNPMYESSYMDGSGLILHITPNLRSYDAGMLTIGQSLLRIPPGRERHVENGTCPSDCTKQLMMDSVNIFGATNHMHYLGIAGRSQLRRYDSGEVEIISEDKKFSYDTPTFTMHKDPILMRPGDSLEMECVFRSKSRSTTTFYGEGTNDEMCFSFVMYYPKQNLVSQYCSATGHISACDWESPVVGGCEMKKLDYNLPESQAWINEMWQKCIPGYCTEECKEFSREKLAGPCFHGDMKFILQGAIRSTTNPERFNSMEFWYKIESCMAEIAMEDECEGYWPPHTDGAPRLAASSFIVAIATGIITKFL